MPGMTCELVIEMYFTCRPNTVIIMWCLEEQTVLRRLFPKIDPEVVTVPLPCKSSNYINTVLCMKSNTR